jgi:hypothetical protein
MPVAGAAPVNTYACAVPLMEGIFNPRSPACLETPASPIRAARLAFIMSDAVRSRS